MLNIDDRLIREVSPKIGPNALSVLLAISIHLNQKTNRCFPSHHTLMQLSGLGKNTVYDALNVLKECGLLVVEQSVNSKKKQFGRRTFLVNTSYIGVFVSAQDMEPLPNSREPESREPESREPESRETYQINQSEQINNKEQIKNVEQVAPQAAAPPHNPENQNPATDVGEVGTLEADFSKAPPVPPPPPAGTKTKRLTKTENDPAEILSHLKGEAADFFNAIREDWKLWTDYKRRDKKGNYKSAETEAVAVTRLFSLSAGRPDMAHEAIEHSIGNSYAGIYAPKQSDKRTAPAQRYSLEDRPQCAHTPDGLLAEMRTFYATMPDLLKSAQEYAGTGFKQELRTVVQKFCANQISRGRITDTFEQHHAALTSWLMTQKQFEQPAAPMTSPLSSRPDGPQMRSTV